MSEQPKPNEGQDSHIEGADERAKRFAVGVKKNPDGTLDYSQALYAVGETHDEMAQQSAEAAERRAQDEKRDAEWRQTRITQYDEQIAQTEGTPDAIGTRYDRTIYMLGSNKEAQPRDKEIARRLTLQRDIYELTSRYAENGYDPVEGMSEEPKGEAKTQARLSFEIRIKILDGVDAKLSKDFVDGKEYTTIGSIHAKTADLVEAVSAITLRLQEEMDKAKTQGNKAEVGSSPEREKSEVNEALTKLEETVAKRKAVYEKAKKEGKPNTEVYWSQSIQPELDVIAYLKSQAEAGATSIEDVLQSADQRKEELSHKTGKVGVDFTQEEYDSIVAEDRTLMHVSRLLG